MKKSIQIFILCLIIGSVLVLAVEKNEKIKNPFTNKELTEEQQEQFNQLPQDPLLALQFVAQEKFKEREKDQVENK